MKLEILAQAINPIAVGGSLDRDVTGICYDSRRATEGCVFVALPGEKTDGAPIRRVETLLRFPAR